MNDQSTSIETSTTSDERTLALVTHLSLLLHLVVPGLAVIAPIIIWRVKRDESVYVADHAVEATNFQISLVIYSVVFTLLGFVTCGIGFAVAGLVYVLGLVGMILAAIAANRGDFFRYPMTLRLVHDNALEAGE
ncbi:MAG: DUF4870 domain-containing protein [Planctomycetota bacterium]